MLLTDIGMAEPDEGAKAQALAAYDAMIATSRAIRDGASGPRPTI
jgi:hypothetical protein